MNEVVEPVAYQRYKGKEFYSYVNKLRMCDLMLTEKNNIHKETLIHL